ncbi:hypothetical protein MTO96_025226 [Rhipicephalus appendiculatus]
MVSISYFSGSSINYQTPCTSSKGRLCNIFRELSLWNQFFWPVGFELRELYPGQLSLVHVSSAYVRGNMVKKWNDAATLLLRLLTHHRCVVSVDLSEHVFKDDYCHLIWDALRESPSLTKLALCAGLSGIKASQKFAAVLPHLHRIRELEFRHVHLDRISVEYLSKFLASTRSLTTLTMNPQFIQRDDAVAIIYGLKSNTTITTLSLSTRMLRLDSPHCSTMFSDYLRFNQTLRTLTISTIHPSDKDLRPIIGALFHNNTLTKLNLINSTLDIANTKLITGMLCQNQTLESFHILRLAEDVVQHDCYVSLWSAALAENNTLNELTLDLSWINPNDCMPFFRALKSNTSLKKVTVDRLREKDVAWIYRALQETGVLERISFSTQYLWQDNISTLAECKELQRIRVHCCDPDGLKLLQGLCMLSTWSHVKSLCIQIAEELFDGKASSLIAQYITNTTALRELELVVLYEIWNDVNHADRTLLQALSLNKSIRKLSIRGLRLNETETATLVDTLQSSRTLCDLSCSLGKKKSTILLMQKLSLNVSSNYTLLNIDVPCYMQSSRDMFVIKDVVRRNLSLVTRAAHFVMGTRHKYCAAAVEMVQYSPGLAAKVQELASVDEDEAMLRIKSSLRSISELDDFMRVAGAVKYSVACHRRDDGQKQLDDLTRDCWLYIRQYVAVDDILYSE